jgi:CHASE1-domain containing sensor protein
MTSLRESFVKPVLPPLLALFVCAITLACTVGLWVHERDDEQGRLRATFDANARQAAGRIEQRIANYEQMLRGLQGLMSADPDLGQPAFDAYVEDVMAGPDAAGLQSMAFLERVPANGLADHIARTPRPTASWSATTRCSTPTVAPRWRRRATRPKPRCRRCCSCAWTPAPS